MPNIICMLKKEPFFSCPIDLKIGWEQSVTRVNESQTYLELCVCVLNLDDTVEFPAGFEVSLAANTIRGTAAGELSQSLSTSESNLFPQFSLHEDPGDYTALQEDNDLFYELINDDTRRTCIEVEVNDDDLLEGVEFFSIEIVPDPFVTDFHSNVRLEPAVTSVEILDCECF